MLQAIITLLIPLSASPPADLSHTNRIAQQSSPQEKLRCLNKFGWLGSRWKIFELKTYSPHQCF